jgi:hypothetical protein
MPFTFNEAGAAPSAVAIPAQAVIVRHLFAHHGQLIGASVGKTDHRAWKTKIVLVDL